jgi:hypothetical protein
MPHKDLELRKKYHTLYNAAKRNGLTEGVDVWSAWPKLPKGRAPMSFKDKVARTKENGKRYRLKHPKRIRLHHQKARYGFTPPPEPLNCECCGTPFLRFKNGACVDHNHITSKFRGWLCSPCNTALGHAKDSRDRLQLLINYLDKCELLS